MFLLALRNLRARTGRTLFTAFAITLGVALVFAARIVGVAADQQATAARASKLAGADLEVAPARAQFFPVSIADDILQNPTVEKVAPIYRHALPESDLGLLGVDPARVLTPYELIAGTDLSGLDGEILLPDIWAAQQGLGVGQTVRLTIEEQPYEFKIVGLLKVTSFGMPSAWVPLSALQAALHTPASANSILVRLKPNEPLKTTKEALSASLGIAYVVTTAQDAAPGEDALAALTGLAFSFASVVVLLAGGYLIYNAFALTLTERKREIGQLRALGMTRGQVLAQTLTEAMLTAGAGSLIGLPIGLGLAIAFVRSALSAVGFTNSGNSAGQVQLASIAIPLDGAVIAIGLGLLVTLVATFTLAWQAGRVSPLKAMSEAGEDKPRGGVASTWYERWGWVGALGLTILFGVTNTIVSIAMSQSQSGAAFFLYALVPLLIPPFIALFAIPALMRGVLWLIERVFPRSVVARLAVGNIRKQRVRALLTSASFAISLMLIVAFEGFTVGLSTSSANQVAPVLAADFMLVRPAPSSGQSLPPVPPELQADLAPLRAEAQVFDWGSTNVPDYDTGFTGSALVAGMDYVRAHPRAVRPVEGSLDEAEQYIANGPSLLLTEVAARRHNLHVGDLVLLGTLEGPVTFTVALVNAGPTIIPSNADAERYFGAYPAFFLVNALPGHDKTQLKDQLAKMSEKHGLQFVDDPEQFLATGAQSLISPAFALFAGLTAIAGIVASLNLVNVLVASVLERQRELGALRALGLMQAQVRGLVVTEAGLLGFVGSLLGVVGALVITWASIRLTTQGIATLFGPMTAPPKLPWELAGLTLILGPGLAMLAALWPADRAASVHPAEAMRAEGATGFLPPAKHLGPIGLRGLIARLPLAAKLSFTTGLVIVVTIAALTALRVNYERQLLEENMRAILGRMLELMADSMESQLPADMTELTPATLTYLPQLADSQTQALNKLFQGDSRYDFTLKYVFITDNNHKVLLSNRAQYNNRTLTDTVTLAGAASSVRLTTWTGERAFEATVSVKNQGGQPLGYIIVGLSTEPVDNITRDIVRGSVGMMLAALAVAILLTVFFTRRALAPLSQIAEASHAVARGDLTQRIPETRWDETGRVARSFNDMVSGLNDRERMRDLFGRYLSREVGEAVLAGRVSLKGERKTITCLYVDMRGSTTFAESHAPEDVMAALNQYFEVIILATEAHGGIVNRFVGDEAVCVFGAPTEYRDHADRAVQAALAMYTGLAYVTQKRIALGQPTLKFGVGLNTGEVTAGATGSEERQEYTMIGDAMNVGARLQGLTKKFPEHAILLSEFTYAALGPKAEAYEVADLGLVEIRGKTQAVRVYGLIGARG